MIPILLFTLATFGNYKGAYDQYILAKNQYIQYRTSITRQEAVTKTLALIIARNKLILEYLRSLGETSLESELSVWEQNIKASDTIAEVNKASLDWVAKLEKITKASNQARLQILKDNLQILQDNLTNVGTPEKMTSGNAKLYLEKLQLSQNKRNLVVFDTNYWSYENLLGYLKDSRTALNSAAQLVYEVTPRP